MAKYYVICVFGGAPRTLSVHEDRKSAEDSLYNAFANALKDAPSRTKVRYDHELGAAYVAKHKSKCHKGKMVPETQLYIRK